MFYSDELNMTVFTDIEYIQLAICNAYGKDKLLWKDRLLFVETKTFSELTELTKEAKEPYQMLKAIYALKDAYSGKPTGYPVGFDATASGLQVYSCLSGCVKTATKVNLVGDNIRHDLYQDIGNSLKLDIERDDLKAAIMTAFYQSEDVPELVFGEHIQDFYSLCAEELSGAWEILQICKQAQKYIGDSYSFKSPSGHDVLIRQKIKKDYKISTSFNTPWLRDYSFNQRVSEFGRKYKDRSIGANLAHVCDSYIANEAVYRAKTDYGFDAFHVFDKLFCSPRNMNRLRWIVRELFAELAESNYFEQAIREITGKDFTYTKHNPDLPNMIRKADYFLS